jgi:hypothetical protein
LALRLINFGILTLPDWTFSIGNGNSSLVAAYSVVIFSSSRNALSARSVLPYTAT